METVPWMTILAYTPFSSSPKFGPRKHWVNRYYCKVYEWEENLNPKITIFRYEEGTKRMKNRDDDRPDAKKSGKTKAQSSKPSFDPRSAAGAVALPVIKSRAEIAKEKEARFLAERARERALRREAMAAAAARGRREDAGAERAKQIGTSAASEGPLQTLPSLGPRPQPAMPWENKTGVATTGIRRSRPARLRAPPRKKVSDE